MGNYRNTIGGSLKENDPSYVTRQADSKLYQFLKSGELCYVFNSRQMGKTSLLVRTMKRLLAEGYACVVIDISLFGSQEITIEQWYGSITDSLFHELLVKSSQPMEYEALDEWWDTYKSLEISPTKRLEKFFSELLLPNIAQNIVIFIDEIDSILSLNFSTDDFFAFIRSCYQRRAIDSNYERINFAFFGGATPSNIIQNKLITPFNIGQSIQLDGFQIDEVNPLIKVLENNLEGKVENLQGLMEEILYWTRGQPLLTQRVCYLLISEILEVSASEALFSKDIYLQDKQIKDIVQDIIQKRIIQNWEAQDEQEHLKHIRDRMLLNEQHAIYHLESHRQLLKEGEIAFNNTPEQMRLRLTGLVVEQEGKLRIYNRIYARIFDLNWVEKELKKQRPYGKQIRVWLDSNYQNTPCLLQGYELEFALKWSDGKSLGYLDYQFLAASQDLDKQNALAETRKQAQQIVNNAQGKAQRISRIGLGVLTAGILGAIGGGLYAQKLIADAQKATEIERQSNDALDLFADDKYKIDALISAMEAGQGLQKLVGKGRFVENYPVTSPLKALKEILHGIKERNRLKGHTHYVNSAVFSADGKRILTASKDNTSQNRHNKENNN